MMALAAIWRGAKALGPAVWVVLVALGAILSAYFKGRGVGRQVQQLDQLQHDDKVKDVQLQAAARRPRNDDDLDDRLRNGRF